MGRLSNESFEEFLNSLKKAGIRFTNEEALRERLAEAQRWRYAFTTLVANGRSLGIRFEEQAGADVAEIHRAFSEFAFPQRAEEAFAASLRATH
jgi:hypothetical protein